MREPEKKIRVGVVVASLDILGGQAIAALRLLDGLSQNETLAASLIPINPRLPKTLRWMQRIKYLCTLVTFAYYLLTLLMKVPKVDVLHVFSASNFSFLLAPAPATLIGKLYGKPVILHYHSGEAEAHLTNWRRTSIPVLKLADRIIVPSGFLVEVFAKFGLTAEAIPNTINLSEFRFHQNTPVRPVLFTNRNFEAHYNVACALRAFALVQQHIPEAHLIVAGDGSQRQTLQALAAELNLKKLEFVGAVTPDAMPLLYDRADIYLNSSVVDNMPLSILEAFACGLAVVTTNAGGIPFMVQDGRNGRVVECGDHRALAHAAITLLENSNEASRLARQARLDCRQYTWEAAGPHWISLYEALVGKPMQIATNCPDVQTGADGEAVIGYRLTQSE
jgi:glycosyltransferase involved in cell wall biosynthesis